VSRLALALPRLGHSTLSLIVSLPATQFSRVALVATRSPSIPIIWATCCSPPTGFSGRSDFIDYRLRFEPKAKRTNSIIPSINTATPAANRAPE
jgi:hypothetical protein